MKAHTLPQLEKLFADIGLEPYRARQVFQWLWQKGAPDIAGMSNLSKALREYLNSRFEIRNPCIAARVTASDATEKFLLRLADGAGIEAVFIPEPKRRTVCVSTQVGCGLGCRFCATSLLGLARNLQAFEIAGQVQTVQAARHAPATNVVFMGMGEPLLNVGEVAAAIDIISATIGLGISQRHVTVSTIGIIEGIEYLLSSGLKVKLAISLNFPDEEQRKTYMPATRKYPLKDLLRVARRYSEKKSLVTFEYVVIGGVNDRIEDAHALLQLLKNVPSKINVIPYNKYPALPLATPAPDKFARICQYLATSRHAVTVRRSRGQEIRAGCGQLAGEHSY